MDGDDTAILARLRDRPWRCRSCGGEHSGLFDLTVAAPDPWPRDDPRLAAAPKADPNNFLSDDLCVVGGRDFFVRGILPIPIAGTDDRFAYGVWSSLSRENFRRYVETFEDDQPNQADPPWFGWFSNDLKGFPSTASLKCNVWLQPNRQRPVFELEPTDHPLALAQHEGVSPTRLLEIYALNGHVFEA